MLTDRNPLRLTPTSILLIGIAVLAVQLSHEFAHWASCEWLGYQCFLTLNSSGSLTPTATPLHDMVINIPGPLLTILTAIIVFYFVVARDIKYLYPVLLICFAMRFLASIFGVFAMYNDEARISLWLGWPPHVLPVIVCLLLFLLVFLASKKLLVSNKYNALTIVIIYMYMFAIVAIDANFRFRLI